MIKTLPFKTPEPDRFGSDTSLTWEEFQQFRSDVKISKKFNDYLKGKNVILVGPSPYLEGKGRGTFIDSFDVVIRFNRGWNIPESQHADYGSKTDIRWHCMSPTLPNGGEFAIDKMLEHNVKWLASQFPKNLDYFHHDIEAFESLNQNQIKFHYFADLVYYLNINRALKTRPNVGPTALAELINYDINSIHLSGITFFQDGWQKGYKVTSETPKDVLLGHAQEPQMHLVKLILENESNLFSVDKEIKNILYLS